MKILFDTNVILDVLLDREPFSAEASILLTKVEQSEIMGLIGATTITTIHYLVSKALDAHAACSHVKTLLDLFVIAPVNRVVLDNALISNFNDFEDAVLHEAALHAGAEYIVTRNPTDFKNSKIPVYTPHEFLTALETLSNSRTR